MNKSRALALAFLLSACAGAEPPQDSGIETPGLWARMETLLNGEIPPLVMEENTAVEQRWWTQFGDPALTQLVEAALANNKSLAIAKARVTEARANRQFSIAQLLPQVYATGSATRENLGFLYNKPVGIAEADAQASWELDLFGKNQARAGAAKALAQSAEAERRGVMVSLLADVARNYFELRNAERQIAITEKNLENQRRTLELTKIQFTGALLSDFDVERAAAQVSVTEASLPALRTARDAAINRLNVLTGRTPESAEAWPQPAPDAAFELLPTQIIVAAPASVLANRPDIRAAERRFAASISASKATARELFPTISLTAMYGIQDTSNVLTHPWSLATSLTQPIFNFGALRSQIDVSDAQQQQAFLSYQQTVLEALEDMENALSAYGHETQHNASLRNAEAQTRKAAELARLQFESGYTGLLDVLVADREVLNAESALAASDADLRKDLARIYTAAGGGWNIDAPATATFAPQNPTNGGSSSQ